MFNKNSHGKYLIWVLISVTNFWLVFYIEIMGTISILELTLERLLVGFCALN